LTESDQFELIIPGIDARAAGAVRQLQVPADGAISVYYPIQISALGEVPVTVSAISELATDAVTRRLFVRVSVVCDVTLLFVKSLLRENCLKSPHKCSLKDINDATGDVRKLVYSSFTGFSEGITVEWHKQLDFSTSLFASVFLFFSENKIIFTTKQN